MIAPDYKVLKIATPVGETITALAQPWRGGDFPLVIFLDGAMRHSVNLVDWGARLHGLADVALLDLPGHGNSAPTENASVAEIADVVADAIRKGFSGRRRALLVGESLGGTVALAVGGMDNLGPVRAVFAADPPMTTTKLWTVQFAFRIRTPDLKSDAFLERLARDTFGIIPDGLTEIIYYPLLGALRVPALIATGDVPLYPQRTMTRPLCLFDKVDEFVAANLYPGKVDVERVVDAGHLLLADAPDACLKIIRRMLTEHLTPTDARAVHLG